MGTVSQEGHQCRFANAIGTVQIDAFPGLDCGNRLAALVIAINKVGHPIRPEHNRTRNGAWSHFLAARTRLEHSPVWRSEAE
jgi:hypothetical protein